MNYRLIDSNAIAIKYPEVNEMPCVFADLPNGLNGQFIDAQPDLARDIATIIENEKDMRAILENAQPERKEGKWIRNDNGTYSCSVCQSWVPAEQRLYARYCLYCGSPMGVEE